MKYTYDQYYHESDIIRDPGIAKDAPANILTEFKDVFADIANALIFNGRQVINPDDLEDTSRLSEYYVDDTYRSQERDVIKYVKDHGVKALLISIENMFYKKDTYAAKCLSYDGASYGQMYREGKIYEIIPIVLYYENSHWHDHLNLSETFDTSDKFNNRSEDLHQNDYHLNVFEVAYFTDEIISRFHSDFRIVADFIAHRRTDPNYEGLSEPIKHSFEFYSLMHAISNDDRFNTVLQEDEERRPKSMKTWSEQFISQGYNSGKSDGIKEGIKEGYDSGRTDGIKEIAERLMSDQMNMPDEEISRITDLSLEEVKKIRQSLKRN